MSEALTEIATQVSNVRGPVKEAPVKIVGDGGGKFVVMPEKSKYLNRFIQPVKNPW